MHGWKPLYFLLCTALLFIQTPALWSFALHKRSRNRMDKENGGRNGIRERKERNVARISTWDVSDVIVRRKIYPAFIFDLSNALHFPLLSRASRVLLFIREGFLEPPSTLVTSVGMQSFGIPWFHENTNSTDSFLLLKLLHKRFYIDNGS